MSPHRKIIKLRNYQTRALRSIIGWLNAHPAALLVAPTGAGKTEIIAAFIDRLPKGARVLVLAHLVDLVAQTGARLAACLPDRSVVTLANSLPKKYGQPGDATQAAVVVGTIDTVLIALDYIDTFDVLIIDEAHHAAAASYLKITARLRRDNRKLRVFGTTATPERSDLKGLEVIFGVKPAAVITLKELIKGGWLVPPRVRAMPLDAIRELRDTQSDDEMARSLNVDVVHAEVIRNWKLHGENRQSIFFCCNVENAAGLAEALRKAGVEAEAVSYETPVAKRTKMLRDFCEGRGPKVLCNPFLLTEGFDAPPVSLIGLVRPFGSKSTLIQAVGRGLRLCDGKANCIVLDFVGAVERHKDLFAGINLKDRRKGSGGGGGGGFDPTLPTVIGYGAAALQLLAVPGIPSATFLRTQEERAALPEKKRQCVDGKEVVSRAEALARGLAFFFTGKPCPKGHLAVRKVEGTHCEECVREKASRIHIRRWSDPKHRKRKLELDKKRHAKNWRDPKLQARMRARRLERKLTLDPGYFERRRERERLRSDPEYREQYRKRKLKRRRELNRERWRKLKRNPELLEQERKRGREYMRARRAARKKAETAR